jgi:hypothetical protein
MYTVKPTKHGWTVVDSRTDTAQWFYGTRADAIDACIRANNIAAR